MYFFIGRAFNRVKQPAQCKLGFFCIFLESTNILLCRSVWFSWASPLLTLATLERRSGSQSLTHLTLFFGTCVIKQTFAVSAALGFGRRDHHTGSFRGTS